VSDRDRLMARLLEVRRRLRLQNLVEGAVLGTSAGVITAGAVLVGRALAAAGTPRAALLLGVAAALGACGGALLSRSLRPVDLQRAARRLDAALGSRAGAGARNDDRVLVALELLPRAAADPFAAAAVDDAARGLAPVPARQVAPWRRPRGLPGLALAAVLALAGLVGPRATTADQGGGARAQGGAGTRARTAAAGDPLVAELTELRQTARELGDGELAALVEQLALVLDELPSPGDPGRGADSGRARMLEEMLAAIEARARAGAASRRALSEAIAAVGKALADEPATSALARRLAEQDADGAEQAARALGRAAASAGEAQRQRLAGALARAAQAARRSGGAAGAAPERSPGERRRRLGDVDGARAAGAAAPAAEGGRPDEDQSERALRRLERDLDEAADRCREDPAACAEALQQRAPSLAGPAQRARGASAHERLARAAQRARGGLAGETRPGGEARGDSEGQAYERAARGERPGEPAAGAGEPGGEAGDERAAGAGADGTGSGTGHQGVVGAAAGPTGAADAARGRKVETSLTEGPGPSRAEAIQTGARYGFARPGYDRVYRDYASAVESALDLEGVPPERRALVRRYFQLIRPR
jgi:hypothetical protein